MALSDLFRIFAKVKQLNKAFMKTKELTFKDVYQLPLKFDEWSMTFIYTSNYVMAFNCLISDKETRDTVIGILNGEIDKKITDEVTYEKGYIKANGKPILLLRGWGHLTGCGALNLPSKQAAKIQDDFANWVVNRLKGIE